jgi:hypothetical protein
MEEELSPELKKHKPTIDKVVTMIENPFNLNPNEILNYKDVLYVILTFLNSRDISYLEKTNKTIKNLIRSRNIWELLVKKDHPEIHTINQKVTAILLFRLKTKTEYWKRMYEVAKRNETGKPIDQLSIVFENHPEIFQLHSDEYDNNPTLIVQNSIKYPSLSEEEDETTVCFFVNMEETKMMRIYRKLEELDFEIISFDDTRFSLESYYKSKWHLKDLYIARLYGENQQSILVRLYTLLGENFEFYSE